MTILRARGDTYSVLTSAVHLFPKSDDDDDDGSKTASLNLGWVGWGSFVRSSVSFVDDLLVPLFFFLLFSSSVIRISESWFQLQFV